MIKDKLMGLLGVGQIQEAVDLAILIAKAYDNQMYQKLVLLAGQLTGINEQLNMRLIDFEEHQTEQSRIVKAVIDYIEQLAASTYSEKIDLEDLQEAATESVGGKTKILFVAVNPKGTAKFQLEKEYLGIRQIFKRKRSQFEITELFNPTLDQLFEEVRIERPNILHIAGASTDKYLLLHRPDDTVRSVPYDLLASAFSLFQPYVKCIFINSWCSTIFLKKISTSLKCAIGSKGLVSDKTSILFSAGFYVAIAQGQNFKEAFLFGSKNTEEEALSISDEEGLPFSNKSPFVLFMNGKTEDENDNTPEDFSPEEPEEIVRLLGLRKASFK